VLHTCFHSDHTPSQNRTDIIPQQEVDGKFDGDLRKALGSQAYVYMAYITSFIVVGEYIPPRPTFILYLRTLV
jgi:hypothetical protein